MPEINNVLITLGHLLVSSCIHHFVAVGAGKKRERDYVGPYGRYGNDTRFSGGRLGKLGLSGVCFHYNSVEIIFFSLGWTFFWVVLGIRD